MLPLTSAAGKKVPALGLNALVRRLENLDHLRCDSFGEPLFHLGYHDFTRQAAGDRNRGTVDIGSRGSAIV